MLHLFEGIFGLCREDYVRITDRLNNVILAAVAQSVERQSHNLKAVSSILTRGRFLFFTFPSNKTIKTVKEIKRKFL